MAISFPNGSYFSVEHRRESISNIIIMASPVQEIDIYTLIKEINYNHVHGSNDGCIHEWKLHTQRTKLTVILVKNSISVPSLQTLVSFKTSNSTILMFLVNILLRNRSVDWLAWWKSSRKCVLDSDTHQNVWGPRSFFATVLKQLLLQ